VTWNLASGSGGGRQRFGPPKGGGKGRPKGERKGAPKGEVLPGGPAGFGRPAAMLPAGQYRVVLTVDEKKLAQGLRIERDPNVPEAVLTPEEPPRPKRSTGPLDY
jgi:hypothetical protein